MIMYMIKEALGLLGLITFLGGVVVLLDMLSRVS